MKLPESVEAKYEDWRSSSTFFFGAERYSRLVIPDWDPTARQVQQVTLSNGIEIDMHLDPRLKFLYKVSYPEGAKQQPASHLLEHLMDYPRGIGYYPARMANRVLHTDGSTGREFTDFELSVSSSMLQNLQGLYPQPFDGLAGLLFGMTVNPDICDETVGWERARVVAEIYRNEHLPLRRLTDFLIPLAVLGRNYCNPTMEAQTRFTTDELVKIHGSRPHSRVHFEITGDPQKHGEVEKIIDPLNQLFGQLPPNEVPTPVVEKAGNQFFATSQHARIVPTYYGPDTNYLTMVSVVRGEEDPKQIIRELIFGTLMGSVCLRAIDSRRLAYESERFDIDFPSEGMDVLCTAFLTDTLVRSVEVAQVALESLLQGTSLNLKDLFDIEWAGVLRHYFSQVDLDRVRASRKLNLPLKNNCAALYYLLRDLTLEDTLEAGRRMNNENRLGFISYGPQARQATPGSVELDESELIKIWKS